MNSRILTLLLVLIVVVYTSCNKENTAVASHPETMAARSKTEGNQFMTPEQLVSGKYLVSGSNDAYSDCAPDGVVSFVNDTITISAYNDTAIIFCTIDSQAFGMPYNNILLSFISDTGNSLFHNFEQYAGTIGNNYNVFIGSSTGAGAYFPKNYPDSIYFSTSFCQGPYSVTTYLRGTKIK